MLAALFVSQTTAADPHVVRRSLSPTKKALESDLVEARSIDATLANTHGPERLPIGPLSPAPAALDSALRDRVTGEHVELDRHLLTMLRGVAARHPGARIELVSGYRSFKLNEMLRKKGHHVARKSQHSLGHACDFRVIDQGEEKPLSPLLLERELRRAGWRGGIGVYLGEGDRFVHADVGPMRRWSG